MNVKNLLTGRVALTVANQGTNSENARSPERAQRVLLVRKKSPVVKWKLKMRRHDLRVEKMKNQRALKNRSLSRHQSRKGTLMKSLTNLIL